MEVRVALPKCGLPHRRLPPSPGDWTVALMLVVKVDLWRHGQRPNYGNGDRLASVLIANCGTGTREHGNYQMWLLDAEESVDPHKAHTRRDPDATLEGVARTNDQRHVLNLVSMALDELVVNGIEIEGVA